MAIKKAIFTTVVHTDRHFLLKEWEVQRKITVTNLLKQIREVLPQM